MNVQKKRTTGVTDSRQEPGEPGGPVTNDHRVDRVFVPERKPRDSAQQAATALLERRRTGSVPPPIASEVPGPGGDTELSLRRQLSRLQRQLAEAQRELANKDDELANEVEKRMQSGSVHDALVEEGQRMQAELNELTAYQSRTAGVEQRLADSIATADELARQLDRERTETSSALQRVEELTRAFDETRTLWNAERSTLEDASTRALAELEDKRKALIVAKDREVAAVTTQLRKAHETEVAELRAAHEQSLQGLRGELEPKAVEAQTLAEERGRLTAELLSLRAEISRDTAATSASHASELAALRDQNAAALASAAHTHASELARANAEKDEQILALQQTCRSAETREQQSLEATEALRETQKKLQRELGELKERSARLEADRRSLTEQLGAATASADLLAEQGRRLGSLLEASESESRRNAMDRLRFVAYLEEGLALLGALPPSDPSQEPEISVSRTSTDG